MSDGDATPPDEWERVSKLLADDPALLAAKTRYGKALRLAVIGMSNPDLPPEAVAIYRRLADELDSIARRNLG